MSDGGKGGPAGAPKAAAGSGPWELQLRAIDAEIDALAPKPRARPATERSAGRPQTLTAFDWLETMVDAVLEAGEGPGPSADAAPRPEAAPETAERGTEFADMSLAPGSAGVLGRVLLGYSPIIDPRHAVIATRLTVVPLQANVPIDAGALLQAVAEVWPQGGAPVSLNVSSETLLNDLLRITPAKNVMIEVPAFIAAQPANVDALLELAARGTTLLIKGRPVRELPREVLRCFKWSIIDWADDKRVGQIDLPNLPDLPGGVRRVIPHIQAGVQTMTQLQESFARGAAAVIGWPIEEPVAAHAEARPDLEVVIELINRIDRSEPVEAIEHTMMRDPALAFELLRHINAPTFGLRVETGSFRHAIQVLGRQQLRRWLAGWLAATSDDGRLKAVNFAALRRGLLMRELAPHASDSETRGEWFMCGVFSLLDRAFSKPLSELLKTLVVPERVRQALVEARGPLFPMLELVRAVESGVPHDIRAAADAVFIEPLDINRALLRILLVASRLR